MFAGKEVPVGQIKFRFCLDDASRLQTCGTFFLFETVFCNFVSSPFRRHKKYLPTSLLFSPDSLIMLFTIIFFALMLRFSFLLQVLDRMLHSSPIRWLGTVTIYVDGINNCSTTHHSPAYTSWPSYRTGQWGTKAKKRMPPITGSPAWRSYIMPGYLDYVGVVTPSMPRRLDGMLILLPPRMTAVLGV